MHQVYIKFSNAEQVKNFVNIIDRLEGDFNLGSGNREVDAKSIIGVFALDLTQPQLLQFTSDNEDIYERLRPFLI